MKVNKINSHFNLESIFNNLDKNKYNIIVILNMEHTVS